MCIRDRSVNIFSGIILLHITTYICIEKNRIGDLLTVFSEASDRNVHIQTDIHIHHAERNRIWCTVFVSDKLLGIDKINSLILRWFSAKGKTLANLLEGCLDTGSQSSAEDGWL